MVFNIPSEEEISARAQERFSQAKACVEQSGRFIAVSLGAWIENAQLASIPHVPIERIAQVPRITLLRVEDPLEEDAEVWDSLTKAQNVLMPNCMMRWDGCSSSELKFAMGSFGYKDDDRLLAGRDATVCMRVYDIHYEYPADIIPVWSRPWIDVMQVDGFPLEFRVFIKGGVVIGVASYYPQRPLPETPEIKAYAQTCFDLADRFTKHLGDSGRIPWMPSMEARFDPHCVNASMDFVVTMSGDVIFLEGGPPFGAGAHPCAFLDREISGFSLSLADGVSLR